VLRGGEGKPGAGEDDDDGLVGITEVRSKAEALSQCSKWLDEHLPHAVRVPCESSAQAARDAAGAVDGHVAALASDVAGAMYGARVVRRGVQDDQDNTTRFVILSATPPPSSLASVTDGACCTFLC
jgi:chorismate mutase/prephenate dehydratase